MIASVPDGLTKELLDVFNEYHHNLKFTVEEKKDKAINFLDMTLKGAYRQNGTEKRSRQEDIYTFDVTTRLHTKEMSPAPLRIEASTSPMPTNVHKASNWSENFLKKMDIRRSS